MPRFILFIRASPVSESSAPPPPGIFEAMSAFNTSLVDAGVMLSGDGLLSSSRDSTRVTFHDAGPPTTTAGPFPVNEIVSGWWILRTKDVEEAVEWAKKVPMMREGDVVEVRRIADMEDFGDVMPEGVKEKERELRERLGGN